MKGVPFLLVAALLLSGCASSHPNGQVATAESGSTIVVDNGEGGRVAVNLTNGTGAVVGQVLSDAGFGLPGARVTIWGAETGDTTNDAGWFQITHIPPGTRSMRAEHESYRPAESEVKVHAGRAVRVTITLVPAIDGDAGDRPHIHDYWAGRKEVLVVDGSFDFYPQRGAGALGTAQRGASTVVGSYQVPCVSGSKNEILSTYASPFYFSDPSQTVWAGTSTLEVTVTWTASDYVGGDKVGIVYRPANATSYSWTDGIASATQYRIPVEPPMWDAGHQLFTLWQFYVCIGGKNEVGPTQAFAGREFVGKYHVKMTMRQEYPVIAETAHPRFWANGTSVRVLESYRNLSCSATTTVCWGGVVAGRTNYPDYFRWGAKSLVPPGTSKVIANLSWTYQLPTDSRALTITFSPANVPPQQKTDLSKFFGGKVVASQANRRSIEYNVKPGESDAFYQKRSNWYFMWAIDGQEAQDGYIHQCGCELQMHLVVEAAR
jgi:hypothetical protein